MDYTYLSMTILGFFANIIATFTAMEYIYLSMTILGFFADIISILTAIEQKDYKRNIAIVAVVVFFVIFLFGIGKLLGFNPVPDPVPPTSTISEPEPDPSTMHPLPYEVTNGNYEQFNISSSNRSNFDRAIASSYIDKKGTHGPTKDAVDGSSNTSWQCGGDRYGTGEWLILFNPNASAVRVDKITVYNGFQSTAYNTSEKDFYYLNSRVEDFRLEFDDGSTEHFSLRDSKGAQNFTFESRDTCYVKFVIESVYAGDKYKDTCVAEVIVK